jgi:hypothetical protein
MIKLLALLLALLSSSANADWIIIDESSIGNKFYVDLDSKKTNGNIVKFWQFNDYSEKNFGDGKSGRYLNEYDCKNEMSRLLYVTVFSGHNLTGYTLVDKQSPKQFWEPIPPNTTEYKIFKAVCY